MLPLLLLLSLLFDADVANLGHREYAVREAASRRLKAAGWAALPPLLLRTPPSPEAADRRQRLLDSLPSLAGTLTRWAAATSDCDFAAAAPPVCRWIEQHGGCGPLPTGGHPYGDLRAWACREPFVRGGPSGDFGAVVEAWCLRNRDAAVLAEAKAAAAAVIGPLPTALTETKR